MKKKLLLGFVCLMSVSCASYFTRKGCEKVNWFQHAHDVAMNGKRLTEDNRLRECEKAETDINSAELDRGFKSGMENYCKPETALAKGTNGDDFNYDFCDSYLTPKLKAQHSEGIKKFCTPEMAYSFASSGGVYKNQCPAAMEKAYQVKYRAGRQVYLKNEITKAENEVASLDTEMRDLQSQRTQLNTRLALLPRRTVQTKTRTYDPKTQTYVESIANTEDPAIKSERDGIESELRRHNDSIQTKTERQAQLRSNIGNFRGELEALKN
jgi:hypothetical protein